MRWVLLSSSCREEPKSVRGDVICPKLHWSPLLFNQSHLTSHSGSPHPHRTHMRKARKTFLASIYEQWGWSLLGQHERGTTHLPQSLPVPFGNRAWAVLWKRLVWHQKPGGSLQTYCLPEMHEEQTRTWLNYTCIHIWIYIYMNHKISVKTCLSQFILLKDKLRYITMLRVYLSKNQFQMDSPQTEGVGVFHWQGHIQTVQKPIKECIWLAVA